MKPLTNPQKSALIRVALAGYGRFVHECKAQGRGHWDAFNLWRHTQVRVAVERDGFTDCGQEHYCYLQAHFLRLAGEDGKAMSWLVKAGTEARRKAEFALRREMTAAGVGPDYVEEIAADRFGGKKVEECDAAELVRLSQTVKRNRLAKAESRKQKAEISEAVTEPF